MDVIDAVVARGCRDARSATSRVYLPSIAHGEAMSRTFQEGIDDEHRSYAAHNSSSHARPSALT
jgi:hypothetical protein